MVQTRIREYQIHTFQHIQLSLRFHDLLVLELHIPESQIVFGVTKIASEFFIANAPFCFGAQPTKDGHQLLIVIFYVKLFLGFPNLITLRYRYLRQILLLSQHRIRRLIQR